jgi:hypothetical protein
VTQDTPAFFTLDHGTVSTSAALVAPVEGRYRLLASASAPVSIDPASVLEDLAWRVARTDASLAGSMDGWRDWSRLEVHTGRAPAAVLVAAAPETGALLERAFSAAGWTIRARFFERAPAVLELGEACLAPGVDAVVMGARDSVPEEEREAAERLWLRVASLARFRDDLAVIACGPFSQRPEGIPDGRLFALPAPVPEALASVLRGAALQVGRHLADRGQPAIDARSALGTGTASLAAVLGVPVDAIEIGIAGGSRTEARPDGVVRHGVIAAAGCLSPDLLDDLTQAEDVLRWSARGGGDPGVRVDALRDLVLQPWAMVDVDGAHLRLAALRAALERLETAWTGLAGSPSEARTSGVLLLAGGTFAALPPAAAALAVVDGIRRPGAVSLLYDHAALLAPLGALPVEDDRRRLLTDLAADAFLPLGAAVTTGPMPEPRRDGAAAGLHVASVLGDQHLRLEPGDLRVLDLPPGVAARLDIDPGGSMVFGIQGRHLTLELTGGLGGLFVDTRPIPLDLPSSGEARRTALEAWEAPIWAGLDR